MKKTKEKQIPNQFWHFTMYVYKIHQMRIKFSLLEFFFWFCFPGTCDICISMEFCLQWTTATISIYMYVHYFHSKDLHFTFEDAFVVLPESYNNIFNNWQQVNPNIRLLRPYNRLSASSSHTFTIVTMKKTLIFLNS